MKKVPQKKVEQEHPIWLFRLVLFSLPLVFFLLLELGLQTLNYGEDLSLFIEDDTSKGFLRGNSSVERRYFPSAGYTSFGTRDVFAIKKPSKTYRVFVLGGSTTAGYPYFYNGSFPSLLKDRLIDAYPDHQIEVINLGMTAVSSFTVRDFARECLKYSPDLLIIYAGHNEFYGAQGAGSSRGSFLAFNRTATLAYLQLKHLKTIQLIEDVVTSVSGLLFASNHENEDDTLMARMVESQAIPFESPVYQRAVENYRQNLKDIVTWSEAENIPLLLGTLVSNLKDQAPFVSIQGDNSDNEKFNEKLQEVESLFNKNNASAACSLVEELVSQEPDHAKTLFLAGRCKLATGDLKQAKEYFKQAKDFDGLRFRASEDINRILKELSTKEGIYLADIEKAFAENTPDGLIGNEYMLEHLHPNLDGYLLMAKAFAKAIIKNQILKSTSPTEQIAHLSTRTDEHYRDRMYVTDLDLTKADYSIETLTSGWPFKEHRRYKTIESYKPKNKIEEIALDILKEKITYWDANLVLCDYYQSERRFDDAMKQARALLKAFPENWHSHKVVGIALVNAKRYDEALPHLISATKSADDAFAYKWIGTIMLMRGQPQKAILPLEESLRIRPDDHRTRYDLAYAYTQTGATVEALRELEKVLSKTSALPEAAALYQKLKGS